MNLLADISWEEDQALKHIDYWASFAAYIFSVSVLILLFSIVYSLVKKRFHWISFVIGLAGVLVVLISKPF